MEKKDRTGRALAVASVAGSLAMAAALVAVHVLFRSQLALAQAADSLSDMLGGTVLLWAMRQSARPADDDHPHGHSRAEPIGALVVAVLAGVLAIEVMRTAIEALVAGTEPELDLPVAIAFGAKVAFKGAIAAIAGAIVRRRLNPAIDALRVDARNDVLVGSVAVIGFAIARAGVPRVDAALALAVALYVGWSALRLARENVGLLMGVAAPIAWRRELEQIAASVPRVARVDRLVATFHGAELHVHVDVTVEASLSLRDAHEIGHAVEERLAREDDVAHAVAHVQPPE